jgi:hypothetical protein
MALPLKKNIDMPVASEGRVTYAIPHRRVQPHMARIVAVNSLPLIGVGGAMAASAWLPADNPSVGFAVLGAEVLLGAFAIKRLLSLVKN